MIKWQLMINFNKDKGVFMSSKQVIANLDKQKRNKQLKKLFLFVVGLRDLKVAKCYFDDLKNLKLPKGEITKTDNVGKTFAFIICYGRIFSGNKRVGKLEKSFLKTLSPDEKLMHNALVNMRNQSYAHNDPEHNTLSIHIDENSKIYAIAQLRYSAFSNNKQIIESLLMKIKCFMETNREVLLKKLYGQTALHSGAMPKLFLINFHSGFIEKEVK